MPFPLATAVRVAVGVNRITSAFGATLFALAGIWQLYQHLKRQHERDRPR